MKLDYILISCFALVGAELYFDDAFKYEAEVMAPVELESYDFPSVLSIDNADREHSSLSSQPPFSPSRGKVSQKVIEIPKNEETPVIDQASPYDFILRGITGVGERRRAIISLTKEGSGSPQEGSFSFEDDLFDSGYSLFDISDSTVILTHSVFEEMELYFDYENQLSLSKRTAANKLEEKVQKEIGVAYKNKSKTLAKAGYIKGQAAQEKKDAEDKWKSERLKRYERFKQLREMQQKSESKKSGDEKKSSSKNNKKQSLLIYQPNEKKLFSLSEQVNFQQNFSLTT